MADVENFELQQSDGHENLEIFGDDSSKIKTFALTLDGVITDIVICDYSDKQLIIITQFQKIGSLILVLKGCSRNLNGSVDLYDVKTICGLDNQEYHLAARYLAGQLHIVKPVLFGISLKDVNVNTLRGIAKAIRANLGF